MSVSYTKGISHEEKYTFSITIERIPYSGSEDIISFRNYLRSIDKDLTIKPLDCFDLESIEEILIHLKNALKAHTLEIIDGKIWFETFYPKWD